MSYGLLLNSISLVLGNAELREWFLNHGADPNLPNTAGYNALDMASDSTPIAVLQELVKHGGQPSTSSALQMAIQSLDSSPKDRLDKAALLLDHGALINARDREWCPKLRTRYGRVGRNLGTPLHCAVAATDEDMVAFLLERGADPTAKDWNGRPPAALTKYHQGAKWDRITAMLGSAAAARSSMLQEQNPSNMDEV